MTEPGHKKIRGILPPLVTPLWDNDTLDYEGLEKLIEHTIAGGVHGLFILGTTGEFPGLSHKLRLELIEQACRIVNRRIPLLVGISDTSFTETIAMAHRAEQSGAEALVVTLPYYFPISQKEILGYLESVVKAISLPLFIYNMPGHTKLMFDVETVKAASEIPQIIGMKDSSSDLAYFKRVKFAVRDRKDFILLVGPEEFMSEFVLMGGDGGLNGGANMFPKLYVDLYNASVSRDFEKINALQARLCRSAPPSTRSEIVNPDT